MRSPQFSLQVLLASVVIVSLVIIPAIVRSDSTAIPGADLSGAVGATITAAPADFSTPLGNSSGICPEISALTGMDAADLKNDISNCASNGLTGLTNFEADKTKFESQHNILDGLGPVYNEKACVDCHNRPVSGGSAQVTELRVGNLVSGVFQNPTVTIDYGRHTIPARSLINAQAICADAEENSPDNQSQRTLRQSLTALGDGFIESIADSTIISNGQNVCTSSGGTICGEVVKVPVLESTASSCPNGNLAVGRFGWKSQHASLLSFSSDAYLNEMGVTNRFNKTEVTGVCDAIPDPEDQANTSGLFDIDHFARFMRATRRRTGRSGRHYRFRSGRKYFQRIIGICEYRLQFMPYATICDRAGRHQGRCRRLSLSPPPWPASFLAHTVISCCTTSTLAMALCKMVRRTLSTKYAPRRCGVSTPVADSCTMGELSPCERPSSTMVEKQRAWSPISRTRPRKTRET